MKIKKTLLLVIALLFAAACVCSGCGTTEPAASGEASTATVQTTETGTAAEKPSGKKEPTPVTDNPGMAEWPEGTNPADEPISLCVLQHDASNEYQKLMWDAFQAYLQPLADIGEIEYFTLDGKGDVTTQTSNVATAITKGVDGILVVTQDLNSNDTALNEAIAEGITVVTYNTRITSVEDYPFVASSDYEEGEMQAEYVAKEFPDGGKFCYIYGYDGSDCAINRYQGFYDKLKELSPNCEIMDQQTSEWSRDKGMAITEDWLIKYADLDAIVCCNDASALGAIEACKNAQRLYTAGGEESDDKVKIYSIDGTAEGINAVVNGELMCTIFQDAIAQATTSAKICIEMIRGVYEGDKEVMIPPELVTSENASEYVNRNAVS